MNAKPDPLPAAAISPLPGGYSDFLLEIKAQIRQRQFQALRAANRELLQLYWWLGETTSTSMRLTSNGSRHNRRSWPNSGRRFSCRRV